MPISATGKLVSKRAAGFTLVEVLAVLVVIGIAAAVVSVSVGDGSRSMVVKGAARELYHSMNLAMEEAVFRNRQIGLRFDSVLEEGTQYYRYEWLQYDASAKAWLPLESKEFAGKLLPEAVLLKVVIEEQQITIGSNQGGAEELFVVEQKGDGKQPRYPDLYFLSGGETQNFSLTISDESDPDAGFVISGTMLGNIEFRLANAEK